MSTTATLQQSLSRDTALAAITEAHGLVGHGSERLVQFEERTSKPEGEKNAAPHPPHELSRSAEHGRGSSRGGLALWSFMGLLAVACIGVAAVASRSDRGQAVVDPISTSLASKEKTELSARPVPYKADVMAEADVATPQPSRAQTTLQHVAQEVSAAAPTSPDLAQQIQMMGRELANLGQGIDQLKTGQAQIVRDNAELTEHAAQELVRHNADLLEDLKSAQAQMARDNVNFAEQLKASQEQMARIAERLKEGQEHVARLLVSEQKPRPKTLVSSPPPMANSTRKPVLTLQSLQVRTQTQDQRHLQPKQ